jgi:hypothetical protein
VASANARALVDDFLSLASKLVNSGMGRGRGAAPFIAVLVSCDGADRDFYRV